MSEQRWDTRRGSKGAGSDGQDKRRAAPSSATARKPVLNTINSYPTPKRANRAGDLRNSDGYEGSKEDGSHSPRSPRSPLRTPTSPTTPRARIFTSNLAQSSSGAGREREAPKMEALPDINLIVLGASRVGKSSFIQCSMELPTPTTATVVARKMLVDGNPYLVRLVEMSIDEVQIEEDDVISWPDMIGETRVPRVDGVLSLYDVGDKASFEDVPEVLNAIDKASLPSLLVSCKCDIDPAKRQLDPGSVEQRAKSVLRKINTLQVSNTSVDTPSQGVIHMVRAVCSANLASRDPAAVRRRTLSSGAQLALSRTITHPAHTRASSEYSGMLRGDLAHARHDSTVGAEASSKMPSGSSEEEMHRSFLNLEESQESGTQSSDSDRTSVDDGESTAQDTHSQTPSDERGYSFDNLVDRLLLLPKSKADSRFRAIFLALYRKFAAPGQLLEAIVHRFEALEGKEVAFMSRTVSQLRYLSVIEQWIGTYPGDFAHPKTRRRMRTFVAKLSNTRIFTAAAREMGADLEVVMDDDDTHWACCDKDRESGETHNSNMTTWPSRSSTLLDDPSLEFSDNLGNLSLDSGRTSSDAWSATPLPSSYGLLHTVDLARRQAHLLMPAPKGTPINKNHWRALIEMPNDVIARELTRMDWIMFSAIRPRDLIRHVSLPAGQKAACRSLVHVSRMIDHFNHLRDWVANFILLRDKAKHRALMLEKLMQVARRLRDLNNYNSLGAFLAGINSAAIHRLNSTRELLTPDIQKDWMKLEILMSATRSYSSYRLAWENSSGERIPFVPLPLRDLVGSQEGNRTYIGDRVDGRINWLMFEVMGETIVGIQKAQGLPYRNLPVGPRQDELRALILNVSLVKDDDALYERSVYLEPSNSGDRRGFRDMFKRPTAMMG